MGVGKGNISRELVKKSDLFAIDTDDVIQSLENRKIKDIFDKEDEKYFRILEQKCALWLEKSVDNTIISTGGGFYNVKNLNKIGTVVYLKADFEWIYERVTKAKNAKKKLKKRPLFNSYKDTKALFNSRKKEYEKKADIVIEVDKLTLEQIVKKLIK